MEQRELTCTGCPMGCRITVSLTGKKVLEISGNTCKTGAKYAEREVTAPARIVTTTVRVNNGAAPVVSVKTNRSVPKEKVFEVVTALKDIVLEAPVAIGEVVCADICGTGADVTATRRIAQRQER